MTKSKRVMRRQILSRIFDRLQEQEPLDYSREEFLNEQLSAHDIDGLLAFRSDPVLDELHAALERLDKGTYGQCLCCKSPISQEVLDRDPAQRMCGTCEQQFIRFPHPVTHQVSITA